MADQIITGNILKRWLGAWASQSVYIKTGRIVDLSMPGALGAVEDAMRESLRKYMAERGVAHLGINITHTDGRATVDRATGNLIERDDVDITVHYEGLTARVILAWEGGETGFDIDGDGR